MCHATLLLSGQDEEWLWVGSIFEKLGSVLEIWICAMMTGEALDTA